MIRYFILLFCFLAFCTTFAQSNSSIKKDSKFYSTDGSYLLGKDKQTLSFYKKGKLKWKVNVIKACGIPKVGKPEVRETKLNGNIITVTFGKHSFAEVKIENGEVNCLGSD